MHPLVQTLVELETLKTWSLIVTLFGDTKDKRLTGSQIRNTFGHIGIKPEAVRVAIHRLKADGWLQSDKQGREAIYGLTRKGLEETEAAAQDVYRRDPKFPDGWQFYLHRSPVAIPDAIQITKELSLAPVMQAGSSKDVLILSPAHLDNLPEWVEDSLVPQHLMRSARVLSEVLEKIETNAQTIAPLDAACLRLLVLHHWRRLALRPGTWAHIGLHPAADVAQSHRVVSAYLDNGRIRQG